MVDYQLEIQFKNLLLRPLAFLISRDLAQLGREGMGGLTSTCEELFGSKR